MNRDMGHRALVLLGSGLVAAWSLGPILWMAIASVTPELRPDDGKPWWTGMTRYHWFVLVVAALGWLFDCLDQQLFNLARKPAMETLLGGAGTADPKDVATSVTRDYVLDVEETGPPLLSIYGGKLTTYRKLAEDVPAQIQANPAVQEAYLGGVQ